MSIPIPSNTYVVKLPASVVSLSFAHLVALKILNGDARIIAAPVVEGSLTTVAESAVEAVVRVRLSPSETEQFMAGHYPSSLDPSLVDFVVAASHSLQTSACEDECLDEFTVAERMMQWWGERTAMAQETTRKKAP